MRRQGTGHTDLDMTDFLCDFCERQWSNERPMVEGHQGSCICSDCLTVAYTELALTKGGDQLNEDESCTLCTESRDDPIWRSPLREAIICKRCTKQSAGVLHKDPDINWSKPG